MNLKRVIQQCYVIVLLETIIIQRETLKMFSNTCEYPQNCNPFVQKHGGRHLIKKTSIVI